MQIILKYYAFYSFQKAIFVKKINEDWWIDLADPRFS